MHSTRLGSGPPLVLVHGLGGSGRSWDLVVDALAAEHEVVVLDLPGHGGSDPLPSPTVDGVVGAVQRFLADEGLDGAHLVGSSLGGRVVLELARRGHGGTVVALDPGGFWSPGEARFVDTTLRASVALVRALRPALRLLMGNPVTRTALLAQLSARPWAVPGDFAARELTSVATTPVDPLLADLVSIPPQQGGPTQGRVVIGWGRHDRLTLPRQAERARAAFPAAELVWFPSAGHFPQWDAPRETADLLLRVTA